jgi:hypothetical protein
MLASGGVTVDVAIVVLVIVLFAVTLWLVKAVGRLGSGGTP